MSAWAAPCPSLCHLVNCQQPGVHHLGCPARPWRDGTPLPDPPAWEEQEWCDGGGTCEHPACLDQLMEDQDKSSCVSCGHRWGDHDERDGCGACALAFTVSCKRWPL